MAKEQPRQPVKPPQPKPPQPKPPQPTHNPPSRREKGDGGFDGGGRPPSKK